MLVLVASEMGLASTAEAVAYRDYDTFMAAFRSLASTYPDVVKWKSVGKTVQGRDIIMFIIGNLSEDKVLLDGAIHGGENLGSELLYFYSRWLVSSGDPLARQILSRTCILIIPALNADGYNQARQNANGVDLNRNFDAGWEEVPTGDPNSSYYKGPFPLSEPESQTLIRVFQTFRPKFYVNLHMFSSPYYAGSGYGNSTYYSVLIREIRSVSIERGVTPFYYWGEFKEGGGYAVSDAARFGITSFLIELSEQRVPLSEIEGTLLPRFIPVVAVLSQQPEGMSLPPWDLNCDGKIDITDMGIVTAAYASVRGLRNWNPWADVNLDGAVDITDVALVSYHYGERYK